MHIVAIIADINLPFIVFKQDAGSETASSTPTPRTA